jgi:predicted lipoprotein with Yx(FWY)xxD motif
MRKKMRTMRLSVLAVLLAAGVAFAAQMPQGVQTQKADSGTTVLADAKGMTLYTYDKDEPGKSNCNGLCAHFWPPLAAQADAQATGDWKVIARKDGSKQWAFKDKPLYTYGKDKKPGETKGDGSGKEWHQATP